MATVDAKGTLIQLIKLQRLDSDVWRIRRRIAEGPQLLARRSERLRHAESRLAAAQARVVEAKKRNALLELEVKTKESEIAKIQGAQGQSRTNEEFRAFGEHIARLRKECRAIEDQVLEGMSQVEEASKDVAELERTRAALSEEAARDAAQWAKDEVEYRAELEAIAVRRREFATTILPGPLSIYERMLEARDGKAVVAAEGRMCGGCQMSITPNDWARLHAGSELIFCRSCERILHLPGVETAAG